MASRFMSALLGAMALVAFGVQKGDSVEKVIVLLEDMVATLEKDQAADEEVYDKMACWCETNDKIKTKAINEYEDELVRLENVIKESTSLSKTRTVEIDAKEKEVEAAKKSLAQITEIRKKEYSEFQAEEKDLLETITAVKAALEVLAKHNAPSFLQGSTNRLSDVVAELRLHLLRRPDLLKGALPPSQRRKLLAFLQAQLGKSPYLEPGVTATFNNAYVPQTGEIFGVLQELLTTFESDLSSAQKAEMEAAEEFKRLKTEKVATIDAARDVIDEKTAERAKADKDAADAKVNRQDTLKVLKADEEYLAMLVNKCNITTAEWTARSELRADELASVSQAVEVLKADDAKDLFSRTFNPAFLQDGATRRSDLRTKASTLLTRVANKVHNPKMSSLAMDVKLDDFTDVKKAIDDMVTDLLEEQEDDIAHKDDCVERFSKNDQGTAQTAREKEDELVNIDAAQMTIKHLEGEIEALNASIADLQVELARVSDNRQLEHDEFIAVVTDQQETQKVVQEAYDFLWAFYGDTKSITGNTTSLAVKSVGPPPPEGFNEYDKHEAAPNVLALLQQVIVDAAKMEAETIRAEQDFQLAYEEFVKETNKSIDAKERSMVDKEETKGEASMELNDAQANEAQLSEALDGYSDAKGAAHADCDFYLKNFDLRQTARAEEIEALRQAKQILSGAM